MRTNLVANVVENGRSYTVFIVDNPTIDDVMVIEMKLRAAEIMHGEVRKGYRVSRDVRDALLRLGVER